MGYLNMAQIKVEASTVEFSYPPGTALGGWLFRLWADGLPVHTKTFDEPFPAEVAFDGIPPGDYVVTVTRLKADAQPIGPTVTKTITVLPPPPVMGLAALDAVVSVV